MKCRFEWPLWAPIWPMCLHSFDRFSRLRAWGHEKWENLNRLRDWSWHGFVKMSIILWHLDILAKQRSAGLKWVTGPCTLMQFLTKRVVKTVLSDAWFGYTFCRNCLILSKCLEMLQNVTECHRMSRNVSKLWHFLRKLTTFSEPRPYKHFTEMIDPESQLRDFGISALFDRIETLILWWSKSDRNLESQSFRLDGHSVKKWPNIRKCLNSLRCLKCHKIDKRHGGE